MHTNEFESTDRIAGAPALSISPEKLFYIIAKAREFDVKDVVTDPDSSSNAVDDAMLSVLEDHSDDPVFDELMGFIDALDEDEQIKLVALAWFGELGRAARGSLPRPQQAHRRLPARHALLGDHLEEALSQFGYSQPSSMNCSVKSWNRLSASARKPRRRTGPSRNRMAAVALPRDLIVPPCRRGRARPFGKNDPNRVHHGASPLYTDELLGAHP